MIQNVEIEGEKLTGAERSFQGIGATTRSSAYKRDPFATTLGRGKDSVLVEFWQVIWCTPEKIWTSYRLVHYKNSNTSQFNFYFCKKCTLYFCEKSDLEVIFNCRKSNQNIMDNVSIASNDVKAIQN